MFPWEESKRVTVSEVHLTAQIASWTVLYLEYYTHRFQEQAMKAVERGLGTRLLNKYLYISLWAAYCCDPLSDALLVEAAPTGVEEVGRVLTVLAHPALSSLAPRALTAATQVLRHSCTHEQSKSVKLAAMIAVVEDCCTCWNFHSG